MCKIKRRLKSKLITRIEKEKGENLSERLLALAEQMKERALEQFAQKVFNLLREIPNLDPKVILSLMKSFFPEGFGKKEAEVLLNSLARIMNEVAKVKLEFADREIPKEVLCAIESFVLQIVNNLFESTMEGRNIEALQPS